MRSERLGLGALVAALALGGCSYEWDALRPGPDSGIPVDLGSPRDAVVDVAADGGARDAAADSATDVGPDARPDTGTDAGTDAGTDVPIDVVVVMDVPVVTDTGPMDTGPLDTGPRDTGPMDLGTPDTGPRDTGPVDTGPRDTGPVDVGTPDTGPPPCTGPLCPCAPTAPSGWCSIGAACVSGACSAGPAMGALVITEIMNDPDVVGDLQGEWFEVYNRSATPVDLRGMRVRGNGTETFEVTASGPLLVPGRGYAVLGKNGDMVINGGVTMLFAYGSAMDLSNSTSSPDSLTLLASDGSTVIDSVSYANTVASGWPVISGRSKSLRPAILDATMNDTSSAWCPGGPAFGRGDFGTPGAANVCQ
ncbi:MAG: lamin tail domain-containing protein [Deltaproteobacteria bacterium]|nr:lamin tail domain-containing protein [Deltaproteobacteria bacterium]